MSANLPAFIEKQCTSPAGTRHNWARHAQSVMTRRATNVPVLRYEEMKHDCEKSLSDAIATLLGKPADPERIRESVRRFSFARQSGRRPGKEDSAAVVRKGTTGDWVNYFNRSAAEVFDRYCGTGLSTSVTRRIDRRSSDSMRRRLPCPFRETVSQMNDDDLLRTPIVVLGSPRSGTTALGEMLQIHSTLHGLVEPRLTWLTAMMASRTCCGPLTRPLRSLLIFARRLPDAFEPRDARDCWKKRPAMRYVSNSSNASFPTPK